MEDRCQAGPQEVTLVQIDWQLHNATENVSALQLATTELRGKSLDTWLLAVGGEVTKGLVICSFFVLLLIFAYLLICGLPKKAAQDLTVKEGCSGSWVVYMGLVYAFVFFSTDQYLASLPKMGTDLGGAQWLMSASIQTVFAIKGIAGICTAVFLACSFLLTLASLCCGCAGRIEWFLGARFLQALGMAVEPIVWAMTRDYFQLPEVRMKIVTALMIMNLVGASVAPMVGNLFAEAFGSWRVSFLVLAVFWALMTLYAWINMEESCPDLPDEGRNQFQEFLRVLDPHSICLLLPQSCFVGVYMTFLANISYLSEKTFGKSPTASSVIMLFYPCCTILGLILLNRSKLRSETVARITVALFTLIGIVSFALASFFSQFFWSYLVGSFAQATVQTPGVVALNVLFFAPLDDCAGVAAAYDMIARSVIPGIFSLISTQALIRFGAKGLSQFQAAACVAAGVIFSYYAISPPNQEEVHETHESDRTDGCG